MTWRDSTDVKDRVFSAYVYALPLFYSLQFGRFILGYFPDIVKQILSLIVAPVALIYQFLGPWANIVIFFTLYLAVIRNEGISRFIRFNAMQAILIDIFLVLCGIVASLFSRGLSGGLLIETLYNVIFLATLVSCFYSMIQSALGKYAEIPTISDAANSQIR